MTVSSTENRKEYAGDGVTTSFATSPVVFFVAADLTIYVVNDTTGAVTNLTLGTHYTISGGNGAVGTVNLAAGSSPYGAPATGTTLVIVRDLAITQAVDFVNNDTSDAEVAEDALDRLTMIAQQLDARIYRSFILADSDVSGASTTIPTPKASALVGWNSAGTALQNYTTDVLGVALTTAYTLTLLDDANSLSARQTLLLDKHGADIASPAGGTLDLDAATGDLIDVTGVNAITAITLAEGVEKTVRFTGILTLTDGVSLDLFGTNITTAAGDFAVFRGYAAGVVRLVSYSRGASIAATLTGTETLTNKTLTAPVMSSFTNGGATLTSPSASGTLAVEHTPLTNSLTSNVALNNTGTYFTGPIVAQGTSGTWFFSATVTLADVIGAAKFKVRLTDGITVIASAALQVTAGNTAGTVTLSGFLTNPAGNVAVQVNDETSTGGLILFNSSGNGKDSTLTAVRVKL